MGKSGASCMTAERKASPARKYLSSSRYLSFDNDTRDQRTHFM